MTLPAKAQWKAASDKEIASLKKYNIYTLLPTTSVPAGHKIIGSRWVYKVKADNSHKGRVDVLRWGQLLGIDCGSTFAPSAGSRAFVWCWQWRRSTIWSVGS